MFQQTHIKIHLPFIVGYKGGWGRASLMASLLWRSTEITLSSISCTPAALLFNCRFPQPPPPAPPPKGRPLCESHSQVLLQDCNQEKLKGTSVSGSSGSSAPAAVSFSACAKKEGRRRERGNRWTVKWQIWPLTVCLCFQNSPCHQSGQADWKDLHIFKETYTK